MKETTFIYRLLNLIIPRTASSRKNSCVGNIWLANDSPKLRPTRNVNNSIQSTGVGWYYLKEHCQKFWWLDVRNQLLQQLRKWNYLVFYGNSNLGAPILFLSLAEQQNNINIYTCIHFQHCISNNVMYYWGSVFTLWLYGPLL